MKVIQYKDEEKSFLKEEDKIISKWKNIHNNYWWGECKVSVCI